MASTSRLTRSLRRTLLAAALVLLAQERPAAAESPPAPELLVCAFDGVFTVSPGVGLVPAQQRFESTLRLTSCTSSDPELHSGVGRTEGTAFGSCLAMSGTAVQRITWNTGRTSTFAGTFANALVLEPVVQRGIAGQFEGVPGFNANVAFTDAQEGARCLGDGMRRASFAGVLVMGLPAVGAP